MSKVRERLEQALREQVGETADPAKVLDALYQLGVVDDVLCRRGAVKVEFRRRYSKTRLCGREVMLDIADEFGLTRQGVHHILRGDY